MYYFRHEIEYLIVLEISFVPHSYCPSFLHHPCPHTTAILTFFRLMLSWYDLHWKCVIWWIWPYRTFLSLHKICPVSPFSLIINTLIISGNCWSDFYYCRSVLAVLGLHIDLFIPIFFFSRIWLLLLSKKLLRFTHVLLHVSICFFLLRSNII